MKEAFLLPNIITLCNLLCGCVSIVLTFNGHLAGSAFFILAATLFDFLDGMAARAFHMKTLIGKDLDSLADVVSFGLAPSCIVYQLFFLQGTPAGPEIGGMEVLPFISFLIAAMAAVRLAVFNNDPGQSHDFKGLPTPSAGIFLASFPLVLAYGEMSPVGSGLRFLQEFINDPVFLTVVVFIISLLMISSIRLFSLKFSSLAWKKNQLRYIFLFISLIFMIFTGFGAFFFIIPLYVLISVIFYRKLARV